MGFVATPGGACYNTGAVAAGRSGLLRRSRSSSARVLPGATARGINDCREAGRLDWRSQLEILTGNAAEIVAQDELAAKLKRSVQVGRPLRVKLGLDPSAPDIHLGHAVVLRKLRQFQDLGHEVILIIGDFTGMIGDPTGRSETRKQLSRPEIEENARTYKDQIFKIIDADRTRVVFNSEWLAPLDFAQVISLAARYTVARMLEREDFADRFRANRPIGIHEFFYPLMQGYDSVELRADVELGATEQRFNILMGRTLQKEYGQEPQVMMLMPILVGLDGVRKMSKSFGNYIAIQDPPSEMFGKAMSIPDEAIGEYFRLATTVPTVEIGALEQLVKEGGLNPRDAKMKLGREIVSLYHGAEAAGQAEEGFVRVFRHGQLPDDILEVSLGEMKEEGDKVWLVRLLVETSLAGSNSEARRLISQGSVKINEKRMSDPEEEIQVQTGDIVQVGKRRFARLKVR
ncbi:MAG: tyrosine--tRNA ligase [Firmicutes bacterium]|nr:tyrosine--tRNA ligase [Bacillota bacterium]